MEKLLKIKTPDKKLIYGKLRGSLNKPLIIFVHGFTASMEEHQYFNAAPFFNKHGFSSFRFNLYHWDKNARIMTDTTFDTWAEDLDIVIRYFKNKQVKKIFVVGHSYGGPTILTSKNKDFDAVALWEPSDKSYILKEIKPLKELNAYYAKWAYGVIIGKELINYLKGMKFIARIKKLNKPVTIIVGSKGGLVEGAKKYFAEANSPKDLVIIKGATHNFDEEGTEEKLFDETLKWFKKFV